MKKLKLFFALFAMLALGVGNAWGAEETVVYTLTPATGSNNSYAGNCDITISDITWNLTGNSTMIPWRIGGKSLTQVDRTLYSKTAMPCKVTKIEVEHGTASSVTVNSFKLIVASDANFSNVITTVEETFKASATTTLTCPSGADWSNAFYKFVYNVTIGGSNKYIQFSGAKFYGEASTTPGEGEEPTPDPEDPETPGTGSSTGWIETAIGNITSSDIVVVTMTNSSATYAMSNDKGTGAAPAAVSVTVNGDKLAAEPADNLKWNITNSSGELTIYPNGDNAKWLYCTATNNGTRVGTNTNKTFTIDGTYLKHTGTSRYVGVYNSQDWRCYTSSSTNISGQTLKFYKYVEQSSEGGGTEEPVASLTAAPTSLIFGNVTQNNEVEAQTFTISGSDFTSGELTITAPEGYSVSPTTVEVDGTLEETTITVTPNTSTVGTFNGNVTISGANLKSSVTVALTMTVEKAPATPTDNVYVKVTSTAGITDGEYLIVYEAGNVAFDGSLATLDAVSNTIEVEITDGTIAGTNYIDDATFTIDATANTIKSASGYYIGKTASGNGLDTDKTTTYTNTITIDADKNAVVKSSGGSILRYNNASNQARFRYYGSGQQAIALYKKASKHTVTIADCTNGTVSAKMGETALATNDQVLSGIQITLSNEATTNYKLTAYDVYKTGEESTKVTFADDNTFIMPEFDVTISATFELAKTLTDIEITTPATQTTFWQGETFNYTGLEVTAHFDGAADEDVTDKVTVTGSTATAGAAVKVTVSYTEGTTTKTTTYTINVQAIPNTKETAYTVADAFDIINKLTTAEGVFISGIISQVGSYNSTYKSITYWISADGTTTNQLQVYSGKGLESADFAAVTDLSVGDQVIVCGDLKKHTDGTYEFNYNNYLVEHTKTTKADPELSYTTTEYNVNLGDAFTAPTLNNPHTLAVTYSSNNEDVATVDADGAVTIKAAGTVTITASTTGNATYAAGSASYTITITDLSLLIAALPFEFNGKQADIEGTPGMTQSGIDAKDYAEAPYLKMNTTGDWLIIRFDSEPGILSYDIKGNSYSDGTFAVQESADGSTYTNIVEYTELGSTETKTQTLAATSRYVKFIYTEKVDGNVALGNIKIALPSEEPEQPGGGETSGERLTEWVLTPLADITTNDLVVITMTKGETTWAMTNDKGTSAAPVASVVTLSADALAAEPDANLKWVVSNDNGTLTIYPYGGYETWLYSTTSNNGIRVGTSENKTFKIDDTYGYLYNIATDRYVGVYNNADWRSYTTMHANISDQTLAFYVKKNANDVLPGTGEDPEGGEGGEDPVVPTPTINATTTFIFNTAEGLNDLGITYPATADEDTEGAFKTEFENNATFTQDGITMTTTSGTTVATRVWLTSSGALDLRVYKGATLTFSVPAEHKISKVVFDGTNISHLLVNGNAVSGNAWAGSAQTITFTTKDDAKTIKINTIAFVVEYTRDVTNKYGTICLPYASASTTGAYFYEVAGKEEGKVYLASVDALKAGVPYIFEKTASTITVTYQGEAVDAPQNGDANGLVGTFEEIEVPNGMYILYNNAFCTNENGPVNKIRAYRAYLNMANVEGSAPQQMPGRRYIGMSVQGENEATSLDNITNGENTTIKVIENGQLIIIRNGEKFNAQGMRL